MAAITFDHIQPVSPAHPYRMDVACFIGFVPMRPLQELPLFLEQWFTDNGWATHESDGNYQLQDVPVPIESWETFQAIFDGTSRLIPNKASGDDTVLLDCYLAAAVRSFFNHGGRKCYVIRLGDPLPLFSEEKDRTGHINLLMGAAPHHPYLKKGSLQELLTSWLPLWANASSDRERYHSMSHLHGLPDAVYVSMPDLPELVSAPAARIPPTPPHVTDEQFVECSTVSQQEENIRHQQFVTPPHCSPTGFLVWQRLIKHLLTFADQPGQTFHLVAAVPLADRELQGNLTQQDDICKSFAHRRLHLLSPWCRTRQGDNLPGGCEPPDGVFIGLQAAQALHAGAYLSAAFTRLPEVFALTPDELSIQIKQQSSHLCLFGRTPDGMSLISDTTSSMKQCFRYGSVSRLLTLIIRAAHHQGLVTVFEPLMRSTWRQVEVSLENLLQKIYENGGLRGRNADEAFQVICDKRTMTQADLDNGRLIASVSFQPAMPVERIHVSLALDGDRIALQEVA